MGQMVLALDSRTFEKAVETCLKVLDQPGAVLLVPTETVYGLCCRWNDATAKEQIFKMKNREPGKPFQMLCANREQAKEAGVHWFPNLETVCQTFCPGPLTIVAATGDPHKTIGFRIPDHPFIQRILDQIGDPLAATSANRSGHPPALSVADALAQLSGTPDLCIDGGPLDPGARASTVVEITPETIRILRPGPISETAILDAIKIGHPLPVA
jgi:L-threonylcarbamoyladenylate synthase